MDHLLLGEKRSYVPDMDIWVEAKLTDGCNCTICTCWIYYNDHDQQS